MINHIKSSTEYNYHWGTSEQVMQKSEKKTDSKCLFEESLQEVHPVNLWQKRKMTAATTSHTADGTQTAKGTWWKSTLKSWTVQDE